jgi:hypothetical protein
MRVVFAVPHFDAIDIIGAAGTYCLLGRLPDAGQSGFDWSQLSGRITATARRHGLQRRRRRSDVHANRGSYAC